MSKTVRKTVLVLVKLGVLSAILVYAFSKLQLNDELALPEPGTPAAQELHAQRDTQGHVLFALTAASGAEVAVPEGSRLVIQTRPMAPGGHYGVTLRDGTLLQIPARQVDGPTPALRLLPGFRSTLREIRWGPLVLALLLMAVPQLLVGVRWLILLHASGVHLPLATGLRLHLLGLFFNTFMPGGTGGDIIKAVAVAHYTHRRAEAISMILVDRALGMFMILIVPAFVLAFGFEHAPGVGRSLGMVLGALLMVCVLFFSARFRRLIRWEAVLARLPFHAIVQRIDAAVYGLRVRRWELAGAVAASAGVQVFFALTVMMAGAALGLERTKPQHYFLFVPMGLLANSMPVSFGGFGLMEGAFLKLFSAAGVATATQGFMLGITTRLLLLAWALPGGLFALVGTGRAEVAEARHAAEEGPVMVVGEAGSA